MCLSLGIVNQNNFNQLQSKMKIKFESREQNGREQAVIVIQNEAGSAPKIKDAVAMVFADLCKVFKDVDILCLNENEIAIWLFCDTILAYSYTQYKCIQTCDSLELHSTFEVARKIRNQTVVTYYPDLHSMPTDSQINFALSKVFDCGDFESIDGYKVARIDGIDTYKGVSVSPFKGELPTLIADYREVEHSRFE